MHKQKILQNGVTVANIYTNMSEHRSDKAKNKMKVSTSTDSLESRRWIFHTDGDDDDDDDENDVDFEEYDEDLPPQHELDSDSDDNVDFKLIRTEPKIDSFDVEALEVPGVQRNDYEDVTMGKSIMLALQMLGVVFGDVGTSPLYTFSVMFSKAPVNGDEDVIGALSLVLYTLILIPSFKYVLIVLLANDGGQGGTFALYSLICRHANVSLLPNQQPSDARLSSFRLKVPSPELERSLKIKECLEASQALKKLLLVLVLAGTSMVIADGVVTPAMSVMSAVGGLKLGAAGIKQDHVVMISVAFLVVLFSVQKYATSKVGIVIGPALLIWFILLGTIGVYNIIKYDSSVLKAFNPIHIYYFFERNSTKAWYSLGGCLLCATGSEAMFADLCHFSVRSVQLTYAFLVLPCLLLGYLGQAAYLMGNHADTTHAFFASTPSWAFWPVLLIANIAALIASRTMTTATFSCIKQSAALGCFPRLKIIHTSRKYMGKIYIPVLNWFLLAFSLVLVCSISNIYEIGNAYGIAEIGVMMMTTILVTLVMLLIWQIKIEFVVSFAVIFLGMELTFFSSVLRSVWDGSWIILVFAIIMFLVMFIWNYGSKLKYESEVKEKISIDLLRQLGSNLGTVRAPGIGLLYNELVKGVPAIFGQFLTTLPAVHSMIIFVCIKYIPVPLVPQDERFLFRESAPEVTTYFGALPGILLPPYSLALLYRSARYGYKDVRKENNLIFEKLLIESLEKFIRREAQERSLASDGEEDSDFEDDYSSSQVLVAPNGSAYSLATPLLSAFMDTIQPLAGAYTSEEVKSEDPSTSRTDPKQSLEQELSFLKKARESGMVYLLGHGDIRARKDSWFVKKLAINYFYAFLRKNSRRGIANFTVPHQQLIQVSMTYMV